MKHRIDYDSVTETSPHNFVADASTLGLKPGEWPRMLQTRMGNGQPFCRRANNIPVNDLVSVQYSQAFGCLSLTILND